MLVLSGSRSSTKTRQSSDLGLIQDISHDSKEWTSDHENVGLARVLKKDKAQGPEFPRVSEVINHAGSLSVQA